MSCAACGAVAKGVEGMTGRIMRRAALALAALGGLVAAHSPAAACALRFGWEQYGVYSFASATGEPTGIDVELFKEAAREAGCRVQFDELPWARIVAEIEKGTLDVASSASRTRERDAFARFSIPYRQADVALFVRTGEVGRYALASLADIVRAGFRLGVIAEYHYADAVARLMEEPAFRAQVEGAADYPVNIQKLLHGRIDGFLADDVGVMISEARAVGAEERIERYPLFIAAEDLHYMFSHAAVDAATVEAIDRSLARMAADGRLQAIFDRFLK